MTRRPEKGVYRSIYSSLWEDPDFQRLPTVAQLVFFCLRTSKDCNFPCIFTIYRSTIYERMVTTSPEDVDGGIDALIEFGWIKYERPVLWIVKGLRNDPHWVVDNSKQEKGILSILKSLPKLQIVNEFAEFYGFNHERIHEVIDKGTDEVMDEGIAHSSKHNASKQGSGSGSGKRKKDLRSKSIPVDNSAPVDNSTAGSAPGGVLEAPPGAPATLSREIQDLGKAIEKRKNEGALPKWRENN